MVTTLPVLTANWLCGEPTTHASPAPEMLMDPELETLAIVSVDRSFQLGGGGAAGRAGGGDGGGLGDGGAAVVDETDTDTVLPPMVK